MNTLKCEVIQDLLPLYIDNVCSDESNRIVTEHLRECEVCQNMYENMKSEIAKQPFVADAVSQKDFNFMWKKVLGVVITLALIISCYAINFMGAFEGGQAPAMSVITTITYIVVIGAFTVITRKIKPMAKISFALGLITFLSATLSMICSLVDFGGFICGILSIICAVPFYGLRFMFEWQETYIIAFVLCGLWLCASWRIKCKSL